MKQKPGLYVLAGVNGAGKSVVGGFFLEKAGIPFYNPDAFAKALMTQQGMAPVQANGLAWQEGMRHLDEALAHHRAFAFETTLGGKTVFEKIKKACKTHNVRIWYCGLSSPQLHIQRVRLRVAQGGHDIPEAKILERWKTSPVNLVALLPFLAELKVFDNSASVSKGAPVPDLKCLLHWKEGKILYPGTVAGLTRTPEWAQAIVESAIELSR